MINGIKNFYDLITNSTLNMFYKHVFIMGIINYLIFIINIMPFPVGMKHGKILFTDGGQVLVMLSQIIKKRFN